jgi:hypothetical protein
LVLPVRVVWVGMAGRAGAGGTGAADAMRGAVFRLGSATVLGTFRVLGSAGFFFWILRHSLRVALRVRQNPVPVLRAAFRVPAAAALAFRKTGAAIFPVLVAAFRVLAAAFRNAEGVRGGFVLVPFWAFRRSALGTRRLPGVFRVPVELFPVLRPVIFPVPFLETLGPLPLLRGVLLETPAAPLGDDARRPLARRFLVLRVPTAAALATPTAAAPDRTAGIPPAAARVAPLTTAALAIKAARGRALTMGFFGLGGVVSCRVALSCGVFSLFIAVLRGGMWRAGATRHDAG